MILLDQLAKGGAYQLIESKTVFHLAHNRALNLVENDETPVLVAKPVGYKNCLDRN